MGDDGRGRSEYTGMRRAGPIPRHVMTQRRRSLLGMWRKLGKTEAEISALIDERIASKTKVW